MQDDTFSAKRPPSVGFVSLGCPKALVDSERILTQLKVEGYNVSASYEGADLIVVNTCGFIDSAVQESLDAIGEAMHANGKVIVTGCLGAKNGNEGKELITSLHPKVLAVTGPHATEEVMQAVHIHLPKPHDPFIDLVPDHGVKLTPKHYAYLKISEGCNHRCTFCIIPSMRGDLVSRPIGEVIREAESLKKAGVKELLVVSQDTSAYGVDLKYRTDFVNGRPVKTQFQQLAEELGELGIWVRMHYVYPYPHVDRVVPLMAEGKILPYLDIPFQHSHPDVLKRMKRPASGERNIERIRAWREACPDITLRSTFITGFPGETEDDFVRTMEVCAEACFDSVFIYEFSPREGTEAATYTDRFVDPKVANQRYERLRAVVERSAQMKHEARIGRIEEVIIEGMSRKNEGVVTGRTRQNKLLHFHCSSRAIQ